GPTAGEPNAARWCSPNRPGQLRFGAADALPGHGSASLSPPSLARGGRDCARSGGRAREVNAQPAEHLLPAERVVLAGLGLIAEAFVPDGHARAAGNGIYLVTDGGRPPVVGPGLHQAPRRLDLEDLAAHAEWLAVGAHAVGAPDAALAQVSGKLGDA